MRAYQIQRGVGLAAGGVLLHDVPIRCADPQDAVLCGGARHLRPVVVPQQVFVASAADAFALPRTTGRHRHDEQHGAQPSATSPH